MINGEDALFNLKVICHAKCYSCVSSSFYLYRIYMGSSSKRYSEEFFDSNLKFFEIAETLLQENQVNDLVWRRCMSCSVTYSIYLYLFLLSTLKNQSKKAYALSRLHSTEIRKYMNKYPVSMDCGKLVRIVYWLVNNHCLLLAEKLIDLRNIVCSKQKKVIKWVEV